MLGKAIKDAREGDQELREQLVALSSGRIYEAQDRAIDLQVSRLRQKLGDAGGADGLIKTVRNEGYVFASVVVLA